MRKKFKIMYPDDYHDESLRGTQYKAKGKDMVVMNGNGIFFVFNGEKYYPSIRRLSNVLKKYDVIWCD